MAHLQQPSHLLAPSLRSRSPSPNRDPRPLYLAYGTHLHHGSLLPLCPSSTPLGIARLRGWRWQVNRRGFANAVPSAAERDSSSSASPVDRWLGPLGGERRGMGERLYGVVYRIEQDEEATLAAAMERDGFTKQEKVVEFWSRGRDGNGEWVGADIQAGRIQRVRVMMFVDREDVGEGRVRAQDLGVLRKGARDGVKEGIPERYFKEWVGSYLPAVEEEEERQLGLAIRGAMEKGVDVRRLVEVVEQQLTAGTNIMKEPGVQASL